jgi:hypothetical protein
VSTPARTFYAYTFYILTVLFLLEVVLEYRHYDMGFTTPIFGVKIAKLQNSGIKDGPSPFTGQSISYGPTDRFPFKSILLNAEKKNSKRIWIASASHAEGGRLPAGSIFPNLICNYLTTKNPCEVINGSKSGMTIRQNIKQLNEYAPFYQPDFAVLYQMYMAISEEEKLLSKTAGNGAQLNRNLIDYSRLKAVYQSLSLYGHLTDHIGGNIKLAGQLKDRLPKTSGSDFEWQVNSFIDACRQKGVKPILTTFAASHDLSNIDKMHFSLRTNFVKYNTYLSPNGWIQTISIYNELLRKISINRNVPLIDIETKLNGDYKYFIDFVHFNAHGHSEVARIISHDLEKIISDE